MALLRTVDKDLMTSMRDVQDVKNLMNFMEHALEVLILINAHVVFSYNYTTTLFNYDHGHSCAAFVLSTMLLYRMK